jgi:hypothetical protein
MCVFRFQFAQTDKIADSSSFPRIGASQKVAVWRGDITLLKVDGIVNAANEWMLGALFFWLMELQLLWWSGIC